MIRVRGRALDPKWLLVGCVAAIVGFGLTAWAAFDSTRLHRIDAQTLRSLSAHRDGTVGHLAAAIGHLGDPVPQALLLLVGIGIALSRGRREAALAGAILVLGADLSTHFLKEALAAPRTGGTLEGGHIYDNSFPSGHTTAAFSMAAAWCLFVPAHRRPLVAAVGFTAACLVGLAAVILHHHFPSDVIGGFFVAAAWTCAVCAVLQLCSSAQESRSNRASVEA
ncbi:MAG TPA: phosphatase PAP2 family protein [Solirubrobacterales bacterium]|nr:phosphatase PAP2 family protein [Solirubrobacterales bacterium]